jgi:ubiquinone/menaquinone biosynthesis C-methylase UbiE
LIRLNLGCGGRPLIGYVNVDFDSLIRIRKRYPKKNFNKKIILKNYNIFKLPFKDSSVDLVRADSLIEHLNFFEEKKFFYEIKRVLKKNGRVILSTPDFESTVKTWLKAKDDWKDFYRNDLNSIKNNHWFGTYTYKPVNRWGYLTASIFGSQNGKGQYHHNAYTKKKLTKILNFINLKITSMKSFKWKGNRDKMIRVIAKKKY